ncbi:MAG: O-antigen ligase family protein [Planctomycetes bacterium]|nr:O-antigen ligase family protein [Planctomycetota bacterium]
MAVLVLIFAAAAIVWGVIYAQRVSLLVGGTIFVALGYIFNHHFWNIGIGPISLTIGRLLLVGLVVLLGWRWYRGQIELRPLTGSDWLAAMLVGYLTLRFLLTPAANFAEISVSPFWKLIASFWMPAALYLVVRNAELSQRTWKMMLAGLTLLGIYLAITGIAEITEQWWAVFPRFIANPELGTHFGRARGPTLMSASLGVFLAATFWAAWFLWAHVARRWQLVLMAAMGLMCAALYFTFTRSTWLGLAGGLAIVPLLQCSRRWRPVLLGVMGIVAIVGVAFVGDKMVNVGRKDPGSSSHSVYQRASFVYVSMNMFADAPMFGCGFGRFYDRKIPYLADRRQQIELESLRELDHHNTFLSLLTETGMVGFALFVGLLIGWGRAAWQIASDTTAEHWVKAQGLFTLAVLIAYVTNALFHDLMLSPSEQWLLCLTTGVTVGLQSQLRCRATCGQRSEQKHAARAVSPLGWEAVVT